MILQTREIVNVIRKGKYADFVTYCNVTWRKGQIGLLVKVAISIFPKRHSKQEARMNINLFYMLVNARIFHSGSLFAYQLTREERVTSFSI